MLRTIARSVPSVYRRTGSSMSGNRWSTMRFYSQPTIPKSGQSASPSPSPSPAQSSPQSTPSTGKFGQMIRKYGPASIIVYFSIGAVDLGLAFGAIQCFGASKVTHIEREAVHYIKDVAAKWGLGSAATDKVPSEEQRQVTPSHEDDDTPSLTSIFILAYGIHKTLFLPVRMAATAAITPLFVRKMHQLGWARYAPRLFGAAKNGH